MYEFSIIDIFPYLLVFILLSFFLVIDGGKEKKAFFCFLTMFVFSAIRYGIGYDYYAYMKMSLQLVEDYTIDRIEPLSKFLLIVASYTHYQVFFVLGAFLTLYPVYRACLKLSVNPAYSLFLYFLFPVFYLESFSIVRNAIAYSFVLYSFLLLCEKKRFFSLLFIITAALFHKSALIGLFIYVLYFIKNYRILHIILYLSSFVISALLLRTISQYSDAIVLLADVEKYSEVGRSEGGSMKLIVNAINIVNFILWGFLSKLNNKNALYLGFFNVGVCLWNAFIGIDSTISLRLSSFFMIFIIFIAPQYKESIPQSYKLLVGRITFLFFVALFASYFAINVRAYLENPERMSNIPYQTIFYHTDYDNYVY